MALDRRWNHSMSCNGLIAGTEWGISSEVYHALADEVSSIGVFPVAVITLVAFSTLTSITILNVYMRLATTTSNTLSILLISITRVSWYMSDWQACDYAQIWNIVSAGIEKHIDCMAILTWLGDDILGGLVQKSYVWNRSIIDARNSLSRSCITSCPRRAKSNSQNLLWK